MVQPVDSSDYVYVENNDATFSTCDLLLIFQSRIFAIHRSILVKKSDFVSSWLRFPGSSIDRSSDDDWQRVDETVELPRIEIEIGSISVPFEDRNHMVEEDDFLNYLRLVYEIWEPKDQPLLALKIAPIADFMQSGQVREICDLMASQSPIQWSNQHCYSGLDFARRWSLKHFAKSVCKWIEETIPIDAILARLLSSTAEDFLDLLPMLELDPVIQVQTLSRYVTGTPLDRPLSGRLRVESDMLYVLCRGFRALSGRWTRTNTIRNVLQIVRSMQFHSAEAGRLVVVCLLDILEDQIVSGPLVYIAEISQSI